jgi:hypothetical protein
MIKFFRKIRQKLISENKFSKYLIYAIGEIILVVIGILIALQINNSNEKSKVRDKEQKALVVLSNTLQSNVDFLDQEIRNLNKYNQSADTIMAAITTKQKENAKFYKHFHNAYHAPFLSLDKSGYKNLETSGFDIIHSEVLRLSIFKLFDQSYTQMENILEDSESHFVDFHVYMRTHFLSLGDLQKKPFEYNAIITDNYYYSTIQYLQHTRGWYLNLMKNSRDMTMKTLDLINIEMED